MKKRYIPTFRLFSFAAAAALAVALSCSNPTDPEEEPECTTGDCNDTTDPGEWNPALPTCTDAADGLDRSRPDLGLSNAVVIKYNGNSAEVISDTYLHTDGNPSLDVKIDGGHAAIQGGTRIDSTVNIVLSGSTGNGSFKVDADKFRKSVSIYMNGVNITNPDGPAVNIQKTGNIVSTDTAVFVHLVGGCGRANVLADGVNYVAPPGDEQAKGTFFSEGEVVFTGGGSLEIRSKGKTWPDTAGPKNVHAIVVDNHFVMRSGNVIVYEAVNDGLHVNKNISITGGTLQIKCAGDAVQNERNHPVNITGGKLTLWTTGEKSHGIACDSNNVAVGGNADIKITVSGKGAKGIRSRRDVLINGGTINISTYGGVSNAQSEDGDTSSSAAGVRAHYNFNMAAGSLTVKSTGENSKGINADSLVTVSGGNIRIEAAGDGIKTEGDMTVTGGSVYSKSTKKKGIDCKGVTSVTGGNVEEWPDPSGGGF